MAKFKKKCTMRKAARKAVDPRISLRFLASSFNLSENGVSLGIVESIEEDTSEFFPALLIEDGNRFINLKTGEFGMESPLRIAHFIDVKYISGPEVFLFLEGNLSASVSKDTLIQNFGADVIE